MALVGCSGSGKSTIASLLERFYEPTSGRITIDGYPINCAIPHTLVFSLSNAIFISVLSPSWLRSEVIGFIEQQPILFATSILENIRYGRQDSSFEEVVDVAKQSQCHDFISALSLSYETNVGERGTQLSGGERQRISIARALLKQPTILILDEATRYFI